MLEIVFAGHVDKGIFALRSCLLFDQTKNYLAPVVRKLDSAIHRINCYPEDKYYDIQLRYPVDSNLSSG